MLKLEKHISQESRVDLTPLCGEIIQVFEDLLEDQENLGLLPGKWLQYLEEIIECR